MSFTPDELRRLKLADRAEELPKPIGRPRKFRVPKPNGRPRSKPGTWRQERRRAQWRAYAEKRKARRIAERIKQQGKAS